jgi:hypothetical protein
MIMQNDFPKLSILNEKEFAYTDSFSEEIIHPIGKITITDVAKAFLLSTPKWIRNLFEFRNRLVSVFGLKTNKEHMNQDVDNFNANVGDQLGFFKVYNKAKSEIVLGEDDVHLNFRVSLILIDLHTDIIEIVISTGVVYNNFLGKVYFAIVKPFHKLIVRSMLKNLVLNLSSPKV